MTPIELFAQECMRTLQAELSRQRVKGLPDAEDIEACFAVCTRILFRLWTYVETEGFVTEQEEISFFKNILPPFNAETDFLKKRYHTLIFRPTDPPEAILFFESELSKLDRFYLDHLEFIRYYESRSSEHDHFYFLDHEPGERENDFSNIIASWLASERYRRFVNKELNDLRNQYKSDDSR